MSYLPIDDLNLTTSDKNYRQTGAGKTHTMRGDLSGSEESLGIIQRCVRGLFEILGSNYVEPKLTISFLEVYNEGLTDLLVDLGFNDVSYRNTSDLSSPNIDALALSGVRLSRYYTHNLCSPSRTAFLSGRFASSVGMQGCVIINGMRPC